MNLFRARAVKDVAEATAAIPVIDVGPAFRQEAGGLDAAAARTREARVLNDSGTNRFSIAFFYSPNPASVIECLPSCVGSDSPPRYPAAVYRDLVLEFYNANYFHRRDYAGDPR